MSDPLASIAAEAEGGTQPVLEGEVQEEGPSLGDRLVELFLPCPDDPLASRGEISQWVNRRLAARVGATPEQVTVGENLAHCFNHLFPGSGSAGWPPIVNLARSVLAYRDLAHKDPDKGELVRR